MTARFLSMVFALLPLGAALQVGRALGWVYGSVVRYHRKDAFEALRRCFPSKSEQEIRNIVHEMYAHAGMNLAEMARLIGGRQADVESLVEVENRHFLEQALEPGKGVVLLTSHLGNWEYLAGRVAGIHPAGMVIKEMKHKDINRFLIQTREGMGLTVFERRGAFRPMLKCLKEKNMMIGFVLDQNMMWKEGVFVDFFDRPACTTPGLAQLAATSGAKVVPIVMTRLEKGRHRATFYPPMDPPPDRKEETLTEHTQVYTRFLEDRIREHPEQWIWMHRRWRTTPDKIGTP